MIAQDDHDRPERPLIDNPQVGTIRPVRGVPQEMLVHNHLRLRRAWDEGDRKTANKYADLILDLVKKGRERGSP